MTSFYSWDDDIIVGNDLPSFSGQTLTVFGGPTPFTFNPFSSVTVSDGTSGGDTVQFRLSFTQFTSPIGKTFVDGATMFTVTGGTSAAVALGSNLTFSGTAAGAQTWLNSLFIVQTTLSDGFNIILRGMDEAGAISASSNFTVRYEMALSCFVQGTLIRTPAGDRPVEMLQAGDLVSTLDGDAKAVKWIGHRTYEAEFGAQEAFVRPVVFKAGSLGAGVPARDLRVSPNHGMRIDGLMVPAASLVNGVTILRDAAPGDLTYFHIELDTHEAVFAEGAPSETFVDHDSRAIFDNADEYGLLHGTSSARPVEQQRLEEGFELAAIRRRLAEIAGVAAGPSAAGPMTGNLERIENGVLHGWVVDSAGAEAVEAEVLVDGEVVGRMVANRYRADLDQAGIMGGRGGFTFAVPASAERLEQVSLRRVVDGKVLGAPAVETVQA